MPRHAHRPSADPSYRPVFGGGGGGAALGPASASTSTDPASTGTGTGKKAIRKIKLTNHNHNGTANGTGLGKRKERESVSGSTSSSSQGDGADEVHAPSVLTNSSANATAAAAAAQANGFANFKLAQLAPSSPSSKGKEREKELDPTSPTTSTAAAQQVPSSLLLAANVDPLILQARMRLPIWAGRQAIVQAVREHDTIVLLGETGSGKTTREFSHPMASFFGIDQLRCDCSSQVKLTPYPLPLVCFSPDSSTAGAQKSRNSCTRRA